jgi:hypothetical protein
VNARVAGQLTAFSEAQMQSLEDRTKLGAMQVTSYKRPA